MQINYKTPNPGDKIIAELDGYKLGHYIFMQIREGEDLEHIKKWRYATNKEIFMSEMMEALNWKSGKR